MLNFYHFLLDKGQKKQIGNKKPCDSPEPHG